MLFESVFISLQEISFKIQFLRLLQSFSDHHEYVSTTTTTTRGHLSHVL